ncbi:unnamed protein product [Scytosiphon promiscuus]
MISHIARTCFPELASSRLQEVQADREKFMAVLPVFYYNVPMFPGETLQLHLFEPRYKLMMKRVVNTSRRFAYVPNYSGYVASVGDVALVAQLSECEFLSDGRVLLVAKLTSRNTVIDHFVEEGTQGLHYCRLEERVDDTPPPGGQDAARLEELHARTRHLAQRVIEPVTSQVIDRYGQIPPTAEGLSMWTTSVLPMTLGEKHALLAGRSTVERLRACERHLVSLSGGGGPPPAPPERRNVVAVAQDYSRHIAAAGRRGDSEEAVAARASRGPVGGSSDSGGTEGAGDEEEDEDEEGDDEEDEDNDMTGN